MLTPPLAGRMERRLLVNYRVDPDVLARRLPAPFRPQLVNGYGVAGVCLLGLSALRPLGLPAALGVRTENAAHRAAVEWDTPDGPRTGVYVPRRDSDSWLSTVVGGRLFPGVLNRADFTVDESPERIRVGVTGRDDALRICVTVRISDELTDSKLFADLADASDFFETGCVAYSDTRSARRFDGLALRTNAWRVEAGVVEDVQSSYFADETAFPRGSAELDDVVVMRNVPVSWHPLPSLSA